MNLRIFVMAVVIFVCVPVYTFRQSNLGMIGVKSVYGRYLQSVIRKAVLRSPFGQIIRCDPTRVFRHGTDEFLPYGPLGDAEFTFRLMGADQNGDQTFNVACQNSGELKWFRETTPGSFEMTNVEPSGSDSTALFTAHANPGSVRSGHNILRVFIKAPSGQWFSFTPFNSRTGPFQVRLVADSSSERYNFELYYEGDPARITIEKKEVPPPPVASTTSATPSQQSMAGPGMRVTFQSCGYNAVGLNVSCANGNTGASRAELLYTSDTSPASCARRMASACTAVGYRTQQDGDTVIIFGSRIKVQAVGPVFRVTDF